MEKIMIVNLGVSIVLILVVSIAVAAYRPEWFKTVVGWLVAAGVVVNGWLNADTIQGWFQ